MLSQLPAKGVKMGKIPRAKHQHSHSGFLWPTRLSMTSNKRRHGSTSGKVAFTATPSRQRSHARRLVALSEAGGISSGWSAKIVVSCALSQSCKVAFVLSVTPLTRT